MLNIGPTAQGGVDSYQRELLGVLGKWVDIYGEAIYEGKPYPARCMGKNFALKGEDCLYFFFHDLGT